MPTAACPDLFVKKEGRARRLSEQETRSLAPALGFPGLPESRSLHRGGAPEQPGLCSLILHVAPPPPGEPRRWPACLRLRVWGLMSLVWRVGAVSKGQY